MQLQLVPKTSSLCCLAVMGNVLASSKPLSAAAGQFLGPPDLSKPSDEENAVKSASEPLENPGSMEELHKKVKELMPANFEGAKLMVNKGLSNHFQVSHTINLSSQQSGYRFGATYVGTKQLSPTEAFPVILGDIDPSGNLNANIIHQLTPAIRCKFASQIQDSRVAAAQLTTDYRGADYTASLTVGNPNLINESGVLVAHYLQSVTKNLVLGGELAYQYGPQVPGGQIAIVSAAARYTQSDSVWSGTLGVAGFHVCYYQKASEQLQIGVELETNFKMQESVATIGYQVDLPKADLVFRGMADTNWNVGGVLEKKLQPLPFTFALSGLLNHSKTQFRLGCGIIIG